jgi:hypothetical protein
MTIYEASGWLTILTLLPGERNPTLMGLIQSMRHWFAIFTR